MKATELRIGNLFFRIDRSKEVHFPIHYPLRIVGIGIFISEVVPNNSPAYSDVWTRQANQDLSPIPLTEEWLLKMGFMKNFPVASREYLFGDLKAIDLYEDGWLIVFNWWEAGKMVNYVHQLQNLYFAITGEELIVVQEQPNNNMLKS